jgi:septal ring factor EnvC (AmiA/AmiB activator)
MSINWGNIATVTVAIVAIIVSARYNLLALRRNANQFEQSQLDKRNDKLREELIALSSAITERKSQFDVVMGRIRQLGPEDRADPEAFHRNAKLILSESLWATFGQAMNHGYAVLLLTEDRQAAASTVAIIRGMVKERKTLEELTNPSTRTTINLSELAGLDRAIQTAHKQLLDYALLNLGVSVYPAALAHPLRDLLFPGTTS